MRIKERFILFTYYFHQADKSKWILSLLATVSTPIKHTVATKEVPPEINKFPRVVVVVVVSFLPVMMDEVGNSTSSPPGPLRIRPLHIDYCLGWPSFARAIARTISFVHSFDRTLARSFAPSFIDRCQSGPTISHNATISIHLNRPSMIPFGALA